MPEHVIALVILGIAAGMLSGMFGIGGGVVIVPALTVLLGFELKEAVGTSLAVLILPVSGFAVMAYYRAKKLQLRMAALVALGLIFGAVLGAQVALELPGATLQRIYGVFLIYVGWRFAEPRQVLGKNADKKPDQPEEKLALDAQMGGALLLVGVTAGIASGLFGIGGGLVIVPALVAFFHFDQKRAVGTSLGALLAPVSLGAVKLYYDAGKMEIATAAAIAVGLIGGAFLGARIALGLPSSTIKRLYGVFLLLISLRFLLQL
ncbi:MAG TPA: sulfite exporter TauE/SafE family protein [Aggregatilineaceae bacterium]|nr:sulfite exporter TauE/SafE family protein [Aggregatilineaceae bacterium]